MTQTTKAVRRETLSLIRSRGGFKPLVIELNTTFIRIRCKGQRHSFTVTYQQLWTLGAKNSAAALQAEREAKRKAKRLERSKR